ncbi:MAG: hypothetical protein A2X99_04670 [Deltaproteobacteria bacterium GWB2_55_19]|nr:MAG: hypothetical protein A2X99_04670 [Deltaproteobacteria bacterium GWB2_55_19]HAO94163.1 hypothetical protein [Deltaproteobacteria bacterium]
MSVKKGNLSINTDGIILRSSEGAREMLGFSEDELSGAALTSLAVSAEAVTDLIGAARSSGAVKVSQASLRRKGSEPLAVYLSVHPLKDRANELYAFLVLVSTAKTAEVPGILSEGFQRMFRFSNDAVAVTDKAGNIMDVNQSFLDTYGYAREELLGKNPRVLKSSHSTKELYERMWKDILDPAKGFWRGEIINVTRDGKEVPVLLSINAVKDDSGEIMNFLGIAFNMTGQKEHERLNRMYIDHIVHDMRGPLTSIMTSTELLLMQLGGSITDRHRKRFESLLSGAQKLSSMTSDILDFSRAESGVLTLKKGRVSFQKVLKDAVQPFQSSEKKLVLNGSPYREDAVPDKELLADEDKLQRIIYNILSNAFKHAASEVRLDTSFTDQGLSITVTDDGKGISAIEAERIFDAFYQTEEGIKTGGAGLGLSIVKSFVEHHGGSVWVEPGKDGGITFGFSIPA